MCMCVLPACMYGYHVKALVPREAGRWHHIHLKLELEMVVSYYMGPWESNLGPLQGLQGLITG